MRELLTSYGGVPCLIKSTTSTNASATGTYSSPSDSEFYQSYCEGISDGHVVLVDVYSDGTTLAKSGT